MHLKVTPLTDMQGQPLVRVRVDYEMTFQRDNESSGIHLSARQAGAAARAAGARRLMLTHLWPGLDPTASVVEGSEAFGREVLLAAPHQRTRI